MRPGYLPSKKTQSRDFNTSSFSFKFPRDSLKVSLGCSAVITLAPGSTIAHLPRLPKQRRGDQYPKPVTPSIVSCYIFLALKRLKIAFELRLSLHNPCRHDSSFPPGIQCNQAVWPYPNTLAPICLPDERFLSYYLLHPRCIKPLCDTGAHLRPS